MPAFEAPGLVEESHDSLPTGVRRRSKVQSFLALQRTIGNRAATRLLSRQPTQKPAAGFHGDGKHRKNDVAYALAIGKADAARLGTAYVLTPADKADTDEKTAWFTGAARDAYTNTITAALSVRAVKQAGNLETHLKAKYDDLREWTKDRIDAWEANAKIPVEDIGLDLLLAVVSIISEGIGGIVLALVEHGFEHALEKQGADAMKNLLRRKVAEEFVALSALEAADLVSEKVLYAAVDRAGTRVKEANQKAQGDALREKTKAALVRKDGKIAAYAESLRDHAQMVKENCEQSVTETYLGMSELDLKLEAAVISALVEALEAQPEPLMREMTSGYLQLHQDPDPAAFEKFLDCGDDQHIAGVNVRIAGGHDIGNWVNPKVNPPGGLELVTHRNVVNPETLAYYRGARLEEVNTTMVFWFSARHLHEGVFAETFMLPFLRTSDGKFPPTHPGCFDDALEWLASHYDQQPDDHSDDERQRLAPLGAKKLYEALKGQRVTDTTAY